MNLIDEVAALEVVLFSVTCLFAFLALPSRPERRGMINELVLALAK